jgi:ATP-dependent Clp protease protease subunit
MEIQIPKPLDRNLYLANQVDQESINKLTKAIIQINESDAEIKKISALYDFEYKPKPIKLYIDSYGGQVYQCFGLLSIMESSKVPIHTIVTGCAMSCGFMIAITGHKRFGYTKSTYLYHQVSSGTRGTVKEMEDDIIEAKRLQKMIEEHALSKTKIKKEKLQKVYESKHDWFIDSKEALKLSIIDEILQ